MLHTIGMKHSELKLINNRLESRLALMHCADLLNHNFRFQNTFSQR